MAVADTTGGEKAQPLGWRALVVRLSGWRRDGSDRSMAQRIAGSS